MAPLGKLALVLAAVLVPVNAAPVPNSTAGVELELADRTRRYITGWFQRARLLKLDDATGCGDLSQGIAGSGMGGCGHCAVDNADPEAYDWTSAKPTSCNPTHHTSSGGCYDWWKIPSVADKYAGFRAFCDAHGSPKALEELLKLREAGREAMKKAMKAAGSALNDYINKIMLPFVVYKKFRGKWEKVGRSSTYKRTNSVTWSSTFSEARATSFAKSLEASSQKTSSSSIEFAFGAEAGVSVGASAGFDAFGASVEVSTEISVSASASTSNTNGQERTFAEAAAEEWGRQAETTFSTTKSETDSLECTSVSCDNGSLYLWTITGVTGNDRKDITRACQFACVPHTSKVKSPKCPVEYCGNAACTCCTTNSWAVSKKGIPVCGMEQHVAVGKGMCSGAQTWKFIDSKTKYGCQERCIRDQSCTGYGVHGVKACYTYHGGRVTGSSLATGKAGWYNGADCYSYNRA